MAQQFKDGYITSIYGRRVGLQVLSSNQSGAVSVPLGEFLIGPDGVRLEVVTETNSKRVKAVGASLLTTLATTQNKYTIDPPIVGGHKFIGFGTTSIASDIQLNTGANTWTFSTTVCTTCTKINSTQGCQVWVHMIGLTTARYGIVGGLSSAMLNSTAST